MPTGKLHKICTGEFGREAVKMMMREKIERVASSTAAITAGSN